MTSIDWAEWGPILVAAIAACAVAAVGGMATQIGPWYRQLRKPSWQPPDWAFAPAWTLIFTLTAWAGVLGWYHAPDDATRATLIAVFAANGLLNMLWSFLFFRWRRPDWALLEVVALWLSIAVLIGTLAGLSTLGGVGGRPGGVEGPGHRHQTFSIDTSFARAVWDCAHSIMRTSSCSRSVLCGWRSAVSSARCSASPIRFAQISMSMRDSVS
jgi:benzodiazapine receptor